MSRNIQTPDPVLERKVSNTISGCWPASPTAPAAASQSLLTAPFRHNDRIIEMYDSGDIEWQYSSETSGWTSPCLFPHSGEQHCVANIGEKLSFDPLPSSPTDVTGVTVPAGVRPGDTLMVPGLNGFFVFELGSDCITWSLCTSYCQEDPAIQIGTVDCCADPPVVNVTRLQGKEDLHNILVSLKDSSGAVVAYADESPQTAVPDFATGTAFTFTGQTLDDGYFVCAEIWSGTQDGSNNLDTTAVDSVVVASDIRRVERFIFSVDNGDGTTTPLMCDASGYIFSGSTYVLSDTPGGPTFTSQADIDAYLSTTPKSGASFCETTCSYCLTTPAFAIECPSEIVLIAVEPCILLTSEIDGCGNADVTKITAEPNAPTTDYEHSIQVSEDNGATWLNPDSFAGGQVWVPWGGTAYCPAFDFPLAPGALVRNCLRRVGSVDVAYDTKQVPDPVVTESATDIALSNAAVEPHPCLDHANDDYVLVVKAFDAAGSLLEAFISPSWKPASATIDLSGAPPDIAAALSLGADGYTINVDESAMGTATQLEYELTITHNYDCS